MKSKTKQKSIIKRRSLLGICIRSMLLYTLIMVFAYLLTQNLRDYFWAALVQSPEKLFDSDSFLNDDFEKVPKKLYRGCSYIVFDGDGNTLYASDDQISSMITMEEVPFIENGFTDSYYSIIETVDQDGYWIFQESYDDETGESKTNAYCRIDSEYNIVEGQLFQGTTQLSAKILRLLSGSVDEQNLVYKYKYKNNAGEDRLMVFRYQYMTDERLHDYARKHVTSVIVVIAATLMGMVLISIFIARRMRRSLEPLNEEIRHYGDTGEFNPEKLIVPKELEYMTDTFRKMALKLDETENARREQEREKNRMIMDLSHDLKTPLTVIQGYAQALENHRVPENMQEQYLHVLRQKSDVSVKMINDLVQYSSMEHPDYTPHKQKTDFCEVCRSCLADRYMEIDNAGMQLEVDIPETPILYDVDVKLMCGAMDNLINNILRYNPEGTQILFHMMISGDEIELGISDTGVGIPENIRQDLFKPFVIGNQARTSTRGTGIGMAIVKRVVTLHNGTIELADSSGSRFNTVILMHFPLKACEKTAETESTNIL